MRAVTVQGVGVPTYRLRSCLCMIDPVAMETPPAFPHEVWERPPPAAHNLFRVKLISMLSLSRPIWGQREVISAIVHA